MRVGIKRYVRQRTAIAYKPVPIGQVSVHDRERGLTFGHQQSQFVRSRHAIIIADEPRNSDGRLVAILLPELPLQHFRVIKRITGDQITPVGKKPDNRVAFSQGSSII